MKTDFRVSIKGIICHEGKLLLRKNQRKELELIGGRLEKTDASPEERIIQEFKEETGAKVKVIAPKEPWLYIIDRTDIIIVPYLCEIEEMPEVLHDEDGGLPLWIPVTELDVIHMPDGYKDSIKNAIPRKSFSFKEGDFLKIIPNYTEDYYAVSVSLKDMSGKEIFLKDLSEFTAPREFLKQHGFEGDIVSLPVSHKDSLVTLNYLLLHKEK